MYSKLLLVATAVCAALVFAEQSGNPQIDVSKLDRNDPVRVRLRQQRRAQRLQELGGMVTLAPTGKVIRIVDAQRQVTRQVVENVVSNIAQTLTVPVQTSALESKGASFSDVVNRGMALPKTGILVALVSDKSAPALLVAPEVGWAAVNVSALSDDFPPADVLGARVQKEVWRGLAIALGAANSQMQPCLMSNVTSLESLDQNKMMVPSPEPIMKMFRGVKARGIFPGRRATYRRACEQGWAPAPTNDVQKAIYEQVKADKERGPTNPLKIVPPKKP